MLHFVCSTGANLRWLIFGRALDTLSQIKKVAAVFKYIMTQVSQVVL